MRTISLPSALLALVCVACTHARTTASPRQEERAAQKADNEGDPADTADESAKDGKSDAPDPEKKGARDSAGDGQASGAEGERTADAKAGDKDDDKDESVDPEDIEVSTTPQGLLEPGALDKVRDKLGVAKGESVQSALRRFQREHGLPATGMLDHETVERLGL